MYKTQAYTQLKFEDFDQPMGLTMNPENRWMQLRKLLGFLNRDIKVIQNWVDSGIALFDKHLVWWDAIKRIYEQQSYLYKNKKTSVPDRIISFHQPWLRPIVRGKAKVSVEFGAKLDVSLEGGLARLEKVSFDAYNESTVLIGAIRRFYDRNGHYPKRVLADKIYRNRENLNYCKLRGIRLSGPALGRSKKDQVVDKKLEYQDNADCVAVERSFSLMKGKFGLGKLCTKLQGTTRTSIAISVIAFNLHRLTVNQLHAFFDFQLILDSLTWFLTTKQAVFILSNYSVGIN